MRQIGSISNLDQAERFADHLRAEGITCTVDSNTGEFRVWIHDEDHVTQAKEELVRFLEDPGAPKYRNASRRASTRMRDDMGKERQARGMTVNLTEKWSRPANQDCPLTFGLIGFSIVVAYFTGLTLDLKGTRFDQMFFSSDGTLQPILRGEVWRIFTPILLHGNMPHLVFNLLNIRYFGMTVESRLGSLKFLAMVLVIAATSNFAQFWFQGQSFGGLSGVVYGLFGYCWVKGKMKPDQGFELHPQTVTMMLVWHVLCMFGVIPNIANWAHGVGLVAGVALAMSGSLLTPLIRRK